MLLAVSTADDAVTADLLRRPEAWGLTRLWLGAGPRPAAEIAEHVVWAEGVIPRWRPGRGDVVVLYHLLWELTHVVFEHPGLLVTTAATDATAASFEPTPGADAGASGQQTCAARTGRWRVHHLLGPGQVAEVQGRPGDRPGRGAGGRPFAGGRRQPGRPGRARRPDPGPRRDGHCRR